MATKTMTKKAPKKKAEPQVEVAEVETTEEPEVKTVAKPTKKAKPKEPIKEERVFEQSEPILCRSVTQGGLFFEGAKTKTLYQWVAFGDETEVEYRDLIAAVRRRSPFIFSPLFIILDDDFIEQNKTVKQFYENSYSIKDLTRILSLPVDEMKMVIGTLPRGAFESLKSIASTEINRGRLDSIRKIKVLDEIFDTNLLLLTEFVSK